MHPIKTYVYPRGLAFNASDIGVPPAYTHLTSMQDGQLIDSPYFIATEDPNAAEIFLYPEYMDRYLETMKTRAQFHELPYHEKYESKHVFFADHDNALPFGSKAIWFRASLLRSKRDPQTVSFPYGCDLNLGRTMEDSS